MRIRCPSCSATYEVPDALVSPPRTVRCAECAQDWMAEPVADAAAARAEPESESVPEAVAAPFPEPVAHQPPPLDKSASASMPLSALDRLAAPATLSSHVRRRDRVLTAAWAASIAALAGLGVAGYTQRNVLMAQWPASKRVYATLGLAPLDIAGRDGKEQPGGRAP